MPESQRIAIVIPCYRVRDKILTVVSNVLELADHVFVVDDACPENAGKLVEEKLGSPRVTVLFHEKNQGVGGAVVTGFKAALEWGATIVVKMDGDGQMEARYLPRLLAPLIGQRADFAKGNRFYDLRALRHMPRVRRFGNFGLTLLSKAASGFWHVSDPTNGYVAIRSNALRLLNFHLLDRRYFFEISLLIQLNVVRALPVDVPIPAKYDGENSSLNPWRVLCSFPKKLTTGLFHRIWWRYFIYDANIVTIFLITGTLLSIGGAIFGGWRWTHSWAYGREQSAGTVALAMLPVILGFQMLLQAVVLDMIDKPAGPVSDTLGASG